MPIVKSDGKSLRICGDFKLTVNQASKLDRYPISKVEDLFAKLAGGKGFIKLDMSQAYQQLLLDEDSRKYAVINTHCGLFQYNQLPFGISSAPGIFRRVTESILSGIAGVVVYIDDVLVTGKLKSYLGLLTYYSRFLPNLSLELAPLYKLLKHNEPWHWTSMQKKAFERSKELLLSSQLLVLVTGKSEQEHLSALEEVLRRIMESGLRLRKDKCVFLAPSVVYLEHQRGFAPCCRKSRSSAGSTGSKESP